MKRLLLACAAAAAAIVVAWAVTEAAYRLVSPRSYTFDPTLTPDSTLGWDSVPALKTLGSADSGTTILYAGDSFTQSAQWPAVAQQTLQSDGLATGGVNLGVSGYGTTQEWLKLQRHMGILKPRAIVLLFFAWNDLRDNYPYPQIYYGPQRTSRPYLIVGPNGAELIPVRWASGLDAALLHSEAYLRVFNRAALALNARIVSRWPDLPARWQWQSRLYYEHPVSWQPFYRAADAHAAYVQGAYDTTVEAFRRIHALAAAAGAELIVIGIDNSFTVDTDDAEDFLKPNPDLDPSLPMQRMAELLGREGITFVDAQPELAALRRRIDRDVYNGPRGGLAGHLGPEGDRLIGEIAARSLERALAPR